MDLPAATALPAALQTPAQHAESWRSREPDTTPRASASSLRDAAGGLDAIRRRTLIVTLVGLAAPAGPPARAEGRAAWVMLERHDCPYCRRWLRDVAPAWAASDLGRLAPLRRVDIGRDRLPADLAFLRGSVFTPTFVLVEDGREVGRIVGYQGEALFWQAAEALVAKLKHTTEEARR